MKVTRTNNSPTKVTLTISGEASELEPIKTHTLSHFAGQVKVPGFREGTAPASMLEKHVDQRQLADEFLEHAINSLFRKAAETEGLTPVAAPKVTINKFVPFTAMEFSAEVDVLGPIKLPNYKTIKVAKPGVKIEAGEINEVVASLQRQQAQRKEVDRAAKDGDEVLIDFAGTDEDGKPVSGAEAKDYALLLGSKTFIPGFEDNVIGMKPGQEKTFTLAFPKDYGVAALQNKKVTFKVGLKKVSELSEPKADDEFAKKAGPFKTLAELKADIKKQLTGQKEREAEAARENELVGKIVDKAVLDVPAALIEDQLMRAEEEEKRNLVYRGQTWQEHLAQEGLTEDQHRDRHRPAAERSVKTGLVLAEIAEKEKIEVTPEELEVRVQVLKGQYTDPQMQAELDKPENRAEISARLRLEKTVQKLLSCAAK